MYLGFVIEETLKWKSHNRYLNTRIRKTILKFKVLKMHFVKVSKTNLYSDCGTNLALQHLHMGLCTWY